MKTFTMITRHGINQEDISAYTLISNDYQTVTVSKDELIKGISSKKIAVNNLEVTPKGLNSTNGALNKYTFINITTNSPEGTTRAVILDRVEKAGKLVGYTVFTQSGTLAELTVADAVALAVKGLISNGKIRHTQDGDIVSAIGGNYPLREIAMDKAPKGDISVDLIYFGTITNNNEQYFGAIISCTSAAEMSKLTDVLNKSNAKVVSSAVKVGGQKIRESLGIKRMGANSLYGVFEIAILEKLLSAKAVVKNSIDAITVSAIKYTKDDVDEATATLNASWKLVDAKSGEDDAVVKKVKEFSKEVISKFGKVQVTK